MPEQLAQDAVQDAFIRICRDIQIGRIRFLTRAYLFGAVEFAAREINRRERKHRHASLDEAIDRGNGIVRLADVIPDGQAVAPAVSVERQDLLSKALAAVTEEEERVIWSRLVEGRTGRESARRLALTEHMVRYRKERGLEKMRRRLGEEIDPPPAA